LFASIPRQSAFDNGWRISAASSPFSPVHNEVVVLVENWCFVSASNSSCHSDEQHFIIIIIIIIILTKTIVFTIVMVKPNNIICIYEVHNAKI